MALARHTIRVEIKRIFCIKLRFSIQGHNTINIDETVMVPKESKKGGLIFSAESCHVSIGERHCKRQDCVGVVGG